MQVPTGLVLCCPSWLMMAQSTLSPMVAVPSANPSGSILCNNAGAIGSGSQSSLGLAHVVLKASRVGFLTCVLCL